MHRNACLCGENLANHVGQIRESAKAAGVTDVNPTYTSAIGGSGKETLNVETPEGKSDVVFAALQKSFPNAGLEKIGGNHVGASIGKEIEWNALVAVAISMATIRTMRPFASGIQMPRCRSYVPDGMIVPSGRSR